MTIDHATLGTPVAKRLTWKGKDPFDGVIIGYEIHSHTKERLVHVQSDKGVIRVFHPAWLYRI